MNVSQNIMLKKQGHMKILKYFYMFGIRVMDFELPKLISKAQKN